MTFYWFRCRAWLRGKYTLEIPAVSHENTGFVCRVHLDNAQSRPQSLTLSKALYHSRTYIRFSRTVTNARQPWYKNRRGTVTSTSATLHDINPYFCLHFYYLRLLMRDTMSCCTLLSGVNIGEDKCTWRGVTFSGTLEKNTGNKQISTRI